MEYVTGHGVKDSEVAGFALAELRKYLAMTEIDGHAPSVIELSLCPPSEFPKTLHDGFRLVSSAGKLSVLAGQDRGLLNGVYEVLNRLGFAFPFPGIDRRPQKAGTARYELFDLQHDPQEEDNIADQQSEQAERMKTELEAWQRSVLRSLNGEDYRRK